jgi:hypothetical protein
MLKLKEIVLQMDPGHYKSLEDDFIKNKAKNSYFLLSELRKDQKQEKEICTDLGLSSNAFYALKSRLLDKIQNHIPLATGFTKEELINTLSKIPEICSTNPRETANAILQKLETDLIAQGMHNELLPVYSALKRINLYTPKYYTYSQQYNKQVAFMVSLEKADEICCEFARLISDFILSKNAVLIDSLGFLKQKIDNIYELNTSKQVLFTKNIIHIQFHLFCVENSDEDISSLLSTCETILNESVNDNLTVVQRNFLDFLFFEYYVHSKKFKQAEIYYEKLSAAFPVLMLQNYMGGILAFPESAFYYCCSQNQLHKLITYDDNVLTDQADKNNSIAINYYAALQFHVNGETKKAKSLLLKTINEFSLVNFLKAEVEIKLLLGYLLLLEKDYDMADDYLRKTLRKIKSLTGTQFSHIEYLVKFFDLQINKESNPKVELKKKEAFALFNASNTGHKQVLRPLIPLLIQKFELA